MILELLMNVFFKFLNVIFDMLPVMEWELPANAIETFLSYLDVAAYFVPVLAVCHILFIILYIELFKIAIAYVRMIWSILPFT